MSEQKYCSFVTDVGTAQMVNAVLLGQKVELTDFAVGDGGGSYYMPIPQMTELKHEVWRGKVTRLQQEAEHPEQFYISAVIPSQVGGFTIREMAVLDKDGLMIAVGNVADIQKVAIEEGMSSEIELSLHIAVNNAGALALKVDPTLIIATKADIEEHNQSMDAHMDIRKQLAALSDIAENAEWFHTYTHTKSGSIHHLEGSGAIVKFKAAADFLKGDTFQVNGAEASALMLDRKELPDDAFKTGAWVMAILDGDTLSFQQKSGAATAIEVPIDPIEGMSAVNVQEALAENFQSVVDGKSLLETAINDKKVTVSKLGDVATFAELKAGVDAIRLAPPNGMEWKQSNIKQDYVLDQIYYANQIWIVPRYSTTYHSADGKNWSILNLPGGCYARAFYYANNLWIAVGQGICYSLDSYTWTISNITTQSFNSVYYANKTWVAVGGKVFYSNNGKTWTQTSTPIDRSINGFKHILYADGIWVTGDSGGFIYSSDGINWSKSNIINSHSPHFSYADGIWIATDPGASHDIYYSLDGKTWTSSNLRAIVTRSVKYANGTWVLGKENNGIAYYSLDGKTWIQGVADTSITRLNSINEVAYGNGVWWAMEGTNLKAAYSYNGINWKNIITNYSLNKVIYANGLWVGGTSVSNSNVGLVYSESLTPF